MDDQQTYLLNGLLGRQFGLGRIVRFRRVERGRQAESFEFFTTQEKEYLVQLYPTTFAAGQLEMVARAVNAMDAGRFSVVPFLPVRGGTFVAEGPQNTHMLVSLAPAGSALEAGQYTDHDLSQVGLRLAWMHRLLGEQLPAPAVVPEVVGALREQGVALPEFVPGLVALATPLGWVHGDVQIRGLLHDGDHQLRTVTDWGLLHWGCPLEDVVDAFVHVVYAPGAPGERGRGSALLHAYDSLIPIRRMAWTPVVARWCVQRLLDAERRALPEHFRERILDAPERLATAMVSCF